MKHDSDILKRIKSYFMRRKSVKEAYEFEREMERDAFLYEAIEGMEDLLTSDIQQALDELDDRLDEKSRNRSAFFTWQAAAIAIVLVAGTAVFTIVGTMEKTPDTAQSEGSKDYKPRTETPAFSPMDDLETPELADTTALAEQEAEGQDIEEAIAVASDEPSQVPIPERPEGDVIKAEEKAKPEGLKKAKSDTEMSGVVSQNNLTEEADSESLISDDFAAVEEKSIAVPQDATARNASKAMPDEKAAPIGGMAAYKAYLKRSLQKSEGMPSGVVSVSFEFDKEGAPRKLEVVNSLCTACDAEALRLISNGPNWTVVDRKERVTIDVEF